MDLQTLTNLFSTTFSPDPNVRKAAELQIRKIGREEGMVAALLQIVAADTVDLATRQACSVYLKNRVQTSYFSEPPTVPVPTTSPDQPLAQSDRDSVKSSILPLLAASPSRVITVQLASTLKTLVARDYPDHWPVFLDSVKGLLGSGHIREVGAGCVASLEVIKAFRFSSGSEVLSEVIPQLFPMLVNIATQMLSSPPSAAQEIPTMLHIILKTYKTSIGSNLSTHQQSPESLVPWGQLLFRVVGLEIPNDTVPENEEEREKCEWWKAKKWAYATLGKLFHRFGNPSQLPTPMQADYGQFAHHFVTVYAPEIFKIYLQQVEPFISGHTWLSKKVQYNIFQFFTECIKPKSTWQFLKPHFETLVSSFVFPQLSFTSARQEVWETDPIEYVRTSIDEYENFSTPVVAATSFLFSLAGNRTKTTFIPILGFINTVLRSNAAPPQRFGALNMTAALGSFIMRHPEVKNNMEQFMLQHVSPQFSSPQPYLRAIALEILGTVEKSGIEWSKEEHLHSHFKAVMLALDDPEMPVRVQAVLALTEMILVHDSVKTAVAPQVGKVVQDLLKLSDETDLDILNRSMEVMVECYQQELLPVAGQLTARLCDSYMRLLRESLTQDDAIDVHDVDIESLTSDAADQDKTYTAMGVAKTIGTIISAVDSSPEILAQVQDVVIPVIVFTLENKLFDLFDNVYDLVDSLTFKFHNISPNMWPVFELTYNLFKSDAVGFLEEMLPSLDNFVAYGTEVFKARADYKQMVLDIYITSISSDRLGEQDRVNGCKLAESILLNLRGHADEVLEPIIVTALDYLDKAETISLRLANLEVLINAVLYNPSAALHLMETLRPGMARTFFDKWFAAINGENKLPRVHDKKLSILALCALLEMDPSGIPDTLTDGWPGIVAGVLQIFKDLPNAIAKRKALADAFEEEDDDDDDDENDEGKLLNLSEDDDDVWDEDSAYLELLAQEGKRLREKSEKLASGGDDDADSDTSSDDAEVEEELGYFSPLDNVDPYVSFKQALTTFQMKNGAIYQAATTSLDVEQQTRLMEIMRIADTQAGVLVQG